MANQFLNVAQELGSGLEVGRGIAQDVRQSQFRQLAGIMTDPTASPEQKMQAQAQLSSVAPFEAQKLQQQIRSNLSEEETRSLTSQARGAVQINAIPDWPGRLQAAKDRKAQLIREGRNTLETDMFIQAVESGNQEQAQQMLDKAIQAGQLMGVLEGGDASEVPAEQRAFESMTEGLTKKEKRKAALIKLGLEPRAVGSAIQTISDKGIEEQIGDASATIKEREKFAELTGASRAKAIDKGFEQVVRINQGIGTIDRAIAALEGGAKTGAIERFLPSIRAASVELENVRNQLALDVIGGVTLGAISEAELDLAKQVGLPEGLNEQELIKHLRDRRAAQEKLRNYYQEQIDHLDQGGTVASFLRMKERELGGTAQTSQTEGEVIAAPDMTQPVPQITFIGFE